jgi:hypothetical protein
VSLSALARVWSYLGGLLALYAAGTWIILQGGKSFAELPGLEGRAPVTSAFEAVIVIGLLLGILSGVGIRHIRKAQAAGQPLLPVVAIADLGPHDVRSGSMRLYQGFFVLVFLFLPAAALYTLNEDVLERGVLWHDGDPALGAIALKNAFAWTRGPSEQDAKEYACRNEVTRAEGYTWFANMRCDIVKENRLKPFDKGVKTIVENVDDVTNAPSCVRDVAKSRVSTDKCENVRDISEECESSERHCRGMQWLPILSPFGQAALTLFGLGMFLWFIVELSYRKISDMLRKRESAVLSEGEARDHD